MALRSGSCQGLFKADEGALLAIGEVGEFAGEAVLKHPAEIQAAGRHFHGIGQINAVALRVGCEAGMRGLRDTRKGASAGHDACE